MAKVYYIVVANNTGVIGPMLPGTYLKGIKNRTSTIAEDELMERGRKDPLHGFAIFERRAEARRAKERLEADRFSPDCTYTIRELGETRRCCAHKVQGWILVFMKDIVSEYNKDFNNRHNTNFETTTATFDMFGEECDELTIFKRRDQAREAAKILNTDHLGQYRFPPGKREYTIVPIYA